MSHPSHHRPLRPVLLVLSVAMALPWLTGCSTVKQTLSMQRQDGRAPVVSAKIRPVASVTGSPALSPATIIDRSPLARLADRDAGDRNESTPLSRQLVPDNLLDEGPGAAGMPTDPLRPDTTLNLDDHHATMDLWGRVRRGFALPALETELVRDHERWYASRPDYVQRMVGRANRYLYHVVDEVERRQMPSELALLPFIESAFNPQAMSSARASGMWQFMPATGKDYELKQNLFRDDRRDLLASTRAALDYLQRLHRMFGDWHLALAAYNWGEGNVQRAIKRNISAGLPTDYLSLRMPDETRNYVPKLYAIRNIVAAPEALGLTLPVIENHPYFVSVPLQRDVDVAVAARLAEIPLSDFQALNPSMNKPVILAAGTPQVLLPYHNASRFMHNLERHRGPLATWTAWVVPRTMRPSDAARHTGMSEASLREINRIPQRMLVMGGSTLLVPRSQAREQDVSESVADNAMMALAPDLPPMRRLVLKAGKRDTVASVARRYKVSASQVAQWNKVGTSAKFRRAQAIVVYVPVKSSRQAVAKRGGRDVSKAASTRISQSGKTKMAGKSTRKLAGKSMNNRKVASNKAAGKSRSQASSRQKVRVAAR
ncbi:MAG TPA: transglycosylase SLT domain-containing protein [Aquabacterium sp.]|nr:transglycosylase SLT domain-containing protein [Aquabacterium sp.]